MERTAMPKVEKSIVLATEIQKMDRADRGKFLQLRQIKRREARNFARNFAAGLIENAETFWQDGHGMSEEQLEEAQSELKQIAARIYASVQK